MQQGSPPSSKKLWSSPPDGLTLGTSDVHIWRVSLEQPAALVSNLRQLLAPDEQARADRFHFEIHRRHFIVGRGVLRNLLARYLKIAPADIEFTYSEYGKPAVADSIAQARRLNFNLAHSGEFALYAFTLMGEVGVDIETIRPDFTGDDIARRFFSATEVGCLDQLEPQLRHEAFFNCWTRKEAFIKAKGIGLSLALDQFDVTLAPSEPAELLRTRWDESEAGRWSLQAIDVGPGYAGAVAVAAHDWRLSCWHVGEERLRASL